VEQWLGVRLMLSNETMVVGPTTRTVKRHFIQ